MADQLHCWMMGVRSYLFVVCGILAALLLLSTAAPAWALLPAPTGFSALPGNGTVTLTWQQLSEPEAAGYNIYRSDRSDGLYVKIAFERHPGRIFTDGSVQNDTLYYYKIAAYDKNNLEGALSLPISALPLADRGKISFAADYIAFSMDMRIVEMFGNARVTMGREYVSADAIQFNVDRQEIRARGSVAIHGRDGDYAGELLFYNINTSQGSLVQVEPQIEHIYFSGQAFTRYNSKVAIPADAFILAEVSESRVSLVARSATLYPSERINLFKTTLYVNGMRIMSMPYYMVTLRGYAGDNLNYSSSSGLTVSMPYYYAVGDRAFGLLRGSYSTKTDFGLGLEQYLEVSDNADCQLNMERVTSSDWSGRFRYSHDLDKSTYGDLSFSYPSAHKLSGNVALTRNMGGQRLAFFAAAAENDNGMAFNSAEINWQLYTARLGRTGLQYGLSAAYGQYRNYATGKMTPEQDLQLTLTPKQLSLLPRASLGTELVVGHNWAGGERSLDYTASLTMRFMAGATGNGSIRYQYRGLRENGVGGGLATSGQSLSGTLYAGRYDSWRFGAYADYDIDMALLRCNLSLDVPMGKDWSFSLKPAYYSDYEGSPWDLDINLNRRIGSRDLRLGWSSRTGRVWGEIGVSAF